MEELYKIVKKEEPSIGQVTIFRTLKLLMDAKIARPVSFGDKTVRYEVVYGVAHHDHLICLNCGRIIEVLDNELETIQNQLCAKHDFKPQSHRLEIFGTCKDCG